MEVAFSSVILLLLTLSTIVPAASTNNWIFANMFSRPLFIPSISPENFRFVLYITSVEEETSSIDFTTS